MSEVNSQSEQGRRPNPLKEQQIYIIVKCKCKCQTTSDLLSQKEQGRTVYFRNFAVT